MSTTTELLDVVLHDALTTLAQGFENLQAVKCLVVVVVVKYLFETFLVFVVMYLV